jgi:signal transduction histidine kinase
VVERLSKGEGFVEYENKILTRHGQTPLVTWSNTHLRNSAGQIEFIIATGIDITERRRLETQLLHVSGREQRRIGQDLHDGLGQHLTGIELMSQVLEQSLARKKRPEAAQAAKIAQHVREAIRQTKSLARGLSPVDLEHNGLMSALQELCASTAEFSRIQCVFECPDPILVEDNTAATNLYRIAQEAVNNAVKHGRAKKIVVRLAGANGERVLSVANDGARMPTNVGTSGMGLQIMRHRAERMGGSLEIESPPDGGVVVRCKFGGGV